jgi:hypothetical protein
MAGPSWCLKIALPAVPDEARGGTKALRSAIAGATPRARTNRHETPRSPLIWHDEKHKLNRTFVVAVSAMATLTACSAGQQNVAQPRGFLGETLALHTAPARVAALIEAVQAAPGIESSDTSVSMHTSLERGGLQTKSVQSRAYAAAFDDARNKASVIAERLNQPLGSARVISEIAQDGRSGLMSAGQPAKGSAEHVMVSGPAAGNLVLAVTFDAGATSVSVFGSAAAGSPPANPADADTVNVMIQARGDNFSDANAHLRPVDAAVRSVARRFGAQVSVAQTNANFY